MLIGMVLPKRSDDRNQTRIDFDRDRRERRQLVEAISFERTGLTQCRWRNVRQVLVFLVNCDRGQGHFPYIASIAASCHLGRRTVDRAIQDAKQLGILSAELQRSKQGRGSNAWKIHWETLATLGVARIGANQRQGVANRRHLVANQRQDGANPYKDISVSYSSVTASLTPAASSQLTGSPAAREEEIEKLIGNLRKLLDVKRADEAVRIALSNGCSIEELRKRAQWFYDNKRRWPPERRGGAAYRGIADAIPELRVDFGWPSAGGNR